jgi:hypothetical protein
LAAKKSTAVSKKKKAKSSEDEEESDDSDKKPKKKSNKKSKDEESKVSAPTKLKFGAPPLVKRHTIIESSDVKIGTVVSPFKKASTIDTNNQPPLIDIDFGGSVPVTQV